MRKDINKVILVPIILAIILAVVLVLDKKNISFITFKPAEVAQEKTDDGESANEPTPDISPTENVSPTDEPTITPMATPTPEVTNTPTPSPTPVPTPTEAAELDDPSEPGSEEEQADNGEEQADNGEEQENSEVPEGNENEQGSEDSTASYNAIYTQEGDVYTLVADSATKSFVIISNQDNSVRQTNFSYHSKYEENPDNFIGPILGYKNNKFVFISRKQIVISDGVTETVLKTFGDPVSDDVNINLLQHSDNRILAGVNNELITIDCTTSAIESYTLPYSVSFMIFTDDYLCFSSKRRIPAGPYYNYIYSATNGEAIVLGSIGEIDEYIVENDIAIIKSGGELFQINLKTNELTSSYQIDKERTLYFPVYGDGVIQGLTEIRFINRNHSNNTVHTIKLPDYWKAECYYNAYYDIPIFSLFNNEKADLVPSDSAGRFSPIDYTVFPLDNSKFLTGSVVKDTLYQGETSIGEGEIFLLERNETINNVSVPFEVIYAWIPIKGQTRAYQLYLYVPLGEDKAPYVNLVKQFLKIQD